MIKNISIYYKGPKNILGPPRQEKSVPPPLVIDANLVVLLVLIKNDLSLSDQLTFYF